MQEKLEKKNFSDQWCKAILNEEFYDSPAVVIVRRLCLDSTTICTKKNALKFTTKPANETSFFRWFFPPSHASKVVQKLAAETIWNSFAGCRADHDISRTNRNFIIPRFPFKLRRHVDISDWILNWHSVEAVRVRGHSTTTWTEFCHFFTPFPYVDSFYTLSVDKNGHFLTPSPPHLVHV